MFLSVVIIYLFDNKFEQDNHPYLIFYLALTQFMYQTMDAIDGKHARNTKRGSPIGQLLDHGCDGLTNNFLLIHVYQAFNVQKVHIIMLLQCVSQVINKT